MRKLTIALVIGVLALSGCESTTKQDAPEPTPSDIINGTHTKVIQMPDGFRNVAFTCHGTVGLYVTSRGMWQASSTDVASLPSSITALADDPNCK